MGWSGELEGDRGTGGKGKARAEHIYNHIHRLIDTRPDTDIHVNSYIY